MVCQNTNCVLLYLGSQCSWPVLASDWMQDLFVQQFPTQLFWQKSIEKTHFVYLGFADRATLGTNQPKFNACMVNLTEDMDDRTQLYRISHCSKTLSHYHSSTKAGTNIESMFLPAFVELWRCFYEWITMITFRDLLYCSVRSSTFSFHLSRSYTRPAPLLGKSRGG